MCSLITRDAGLKCWLANKTKNQKEKLLVVHLLLSYLAYFVEMEGVVFSQEMLSQIGDADNKGEISRSKPKSFFSNPSISLLV